MCIILTSAFLRDDSSKIGLYFVKEKVPYDEKHYPIEILFEFEGIVKTVMSLESKGILFRDGIREISLGIFIAQFQDVDGNPFSIYDVKN